MRKVKVRKGSVEQKLSSLIIESKFKLLEEDLLNEGFFDDFKKDYAAAEANRKRRKNLQKVDTRQKQKERERILLLRKGLPIPEDLTKETLKQYYIRNSLPVPSYLEGKEKDDSTRTAENEDSLITKFSNLLGLHPNKEEQVRKSVKSIGGGAKATGNFLNNLYKKLTGVPFIGTSGEVIATGEELTDGPDTSADSGSGQVDSGSSESQKTDLGGISSYGDVEGEIAGIDVNTEMWYIYISHVKRRAKKFLGKLVTGDDEKDVRAFIKGKVEDELLNSSKNDVVVDKIPGKRKFKWSEVTQNINSDKTNDKSDFTKYVSGHYAVGTDSGSGTYIIEPVGKISGFSNYGELNE